MPSPQSKTTYSISISVRNNDTKEHVYDQPFTVEGWEDAIEKLQDMASDAALEIYSDAEDRGEAR